MSESRLINSYTMKYIIISAIVILLLMATNPSKSDHVEKVRISLKTAFNKSISKKVENSFAIGIGAYLSDQIVDTFIERSVSVDNFFLFSRTHFRYLDKDIIIGYGCLGNVFISEKLQIEADKILSSITELNDE